MTSSSRLRRLAGALRSRAAALRRRPLAAVLLAASAALGLAAALPPGGEQSVVVASSALTAGDEISPADLTQRPFPPHLVPDGALTDPDAAVGNRVAGDVTAGSPLTSASLIAEAEGSADGLRVPVVFGDAEAAAVIRPGQRLRIFSAESGGEPLVESAVVADVRTGGEGLGGAVRPPVVLVSVDESSADALAGAAGSYLSFALLG